MVSNMSCTWPPIRSVMALPAPRYGTCTMFDTGHHLELLARHVDAGADTGRGEVELAGVGLRMRDEFGHGLDRQIVVDHQDVGHARGAGDRRDVAQEVEVQVLVERVVDGVCRHPLQQRVAVRRGLHHRLGPDVAAGARAVLDQDRLADPLRQPLPHQPGIDVGAATGRKSDDDADRLRRIGLRPRAARQRRRGERRPVAICRIRRRESFILVPSIILP